MRRVVLAVLWVAIPAAGLAGGETPPTDASRLFAWLQSGAYKGWPRETGAHPSAGPHPVRVLTYLNPALDASLRAGVPSHPPGAAAVKELYDAAGKPAGWAVAVKTEKASRAGKGWYWYEVTSASDGARPVAADRGVPLCVGCHAPGRDFILSRHPLR